MEGIWHETDYGERQIPVTVDDRERHGGVPDALARMEAFDIHIERLPVGDYRVDGRFLFERKTLSDFVSSLISGRLFDQALRLAKQSEHQPVLILEGCGSELRNSGLRREAVQGAMIMIAVFIGLPVLRTRDPAETAGALLYTAQQARTLARGGLPRRGYRPKGKAALQRYILQGLPGIGPARAQQLLARFGTVEAALTAGEDALASVPGIGPDTARKIRWAIGETPAAYVAADDRRFS